MDKYTFKKEERLCNKRRIESLFHSGSSFIVYPLRAVYLADLPVNSRTSPLEVLISVPKKRFKKAVSRNRIKRLIREAYRLEKSQLRFFLEAQSLHLSVAIQYVGTEELPLSVLLAKIRQLMRRIEDELSKTNLGETH
ncbi:MAG: ribonuclease P protein component [Sphingobacterium sp.]